MKQFALLIKEDAEVIPTQGEVEEMQSAYMKWMDELIEGGNYVTGARLHQSRETLRPDGEIISDGPYVETKEMVGGIVIIKAKNMEEALVLTQNCPMHRIHHIDLREISHVFN